MSETRIRLIRVHGVVAAALLLVGPRIASLGESHDPRLNEAIQREPRVEC